MQEQVGAYPQNPENVFPHARSVAWAHEASGSGTLHVAAAIAYRGRRFTLVSSIPESNRARSVASISTCAASGGQRGLWKVPRSNRFIQIARPS
jgi:hypothetical protein